MLWLYLHFPRLPLDHIARSTASPIPFAIITGTPPRIEWVSDAAAQGGLKPGISLNTAYCLLPELQVAHHEPNKTALILKELAAIAYQYSSHITLYPPDGLLLEVGSMLRLFGGINELWNKLYAEISNQGFSLWLATGPTPLSARLLARNNQGQCSATVKPLLEHIKRLSLYEAELPEKTAERCYRMGIKTIQQLIELPSLQLSERLGPDLNLYINKITGKEPDPQVAYKAPLEFLRRLDFIEDITHINGVLFPLQRQLQALSEYLVNYQFSTDTITLTLLHRQHPDTHIQVRCAQPEHESDVFIQLCRLRLERYTLPEAVIALTLKVDKLTPLDVTHSDLFDTKGQNKNNVLQLIGKLHARLGDQSIRTLTTSSDHRPEKSQQSIPATIQRAQTVKAQPILIQPNTTAKTISPHSERRPLWLTPEPYPINPNALIFLIGPERISSGWWDNDGVLRDYYIARFPNNALGWVFRDASSQWFLQGWFA